MTVLSLVLCRRYLDACSAAQTKQEEDLENYAAATRNNGGGKPKGARKSKSGKTYEITEVRSEKQAGPKETGETQQCPEQ